MNQPLRWREMNAVAPQGARELLLYAHGPAPMSAAARARSASRVAALAATPVAAGLLMKWLTGKSLGLFAAFGLLGAAIGLTTYAVRPHGVISAPIAAETPTVGAVRTVPNAPIATPTSAQSPTQPAPAAETALTSATGTMTATTLLPPRGAPAAGAAGGVDTMAAEQTMLEAARQSMATSPTTALARLEAHKAKYPVGKLAAEREFLAVKALKSLDRNAEAKKRGGAFLATWPESLYSDLVRKQIEGL